MQITIAEIETLTARITEEIMCIPEMSFGEAEVREVVRKILHEGAALKLIESEEK